MPINLSIKAVPDELAEQQLRHRTKRHHRSLQGELMAILEESVGLSRYLTPSDVLEKVRRLGLTTPAQSSTLIREDRDGR